MKWNYVFIRFFFGLNRIVFFSFDVLECIELDEIFMFLDINCYCRLFFFVFFICFYDKYVDSMVFWKIGFI